MWCKCESVFSSHFWDIPLYQFTLKETTAGNFRRVVESQRVRIEVKMKRFHLMKRSVEQKMYKSLDLRDWYSDLIFCLCSSPTKAELLIHSMCFHTWSYCKKKKKQKKKNTSLIVHCSCCRLGWRNVIRRFRRPSLCNHSSVAASHHRNRRVLFPELSMSALIFVLLSVSAAPLMRSALINSWKNFTGSVKSKVRRGWVFVQNAH